MGRKLTQGHVTKLMMKVKRKKRGENESYAREDDEVEVQQNLKSKGKRPLSTPTTSCQCSKKGQYKKDPCIRTSMNLRKQQSIREEANNIVFYDKKIPTQNYSRYMLLLLQQHCILCGQAKQLQEDG